MAMHAESRSWAAGSTWTGRLKGAGHVNSGQIASCWCLPTVAMTTQRQRTRRRGRERAARRKGQIRGVVPVKLEAVYIH